MASDRRVGRVVGPWRRLRPLFAAKRRSIVAVVAVSVIGGVAEATMLAAVAHIAAAMSVGESVATLSLGPISARLPVGRLLAASSGLAGIRLAAQAVLARIPVGISAAVQADLRTHVFESYTRASWSVQAEERDGHLQELMGSHSGQASAAVIQATNGIAAFVTFGVMLAFALALSPAAAAAIVASAVSLFMALRPLASRVRLRAREGSRANVAHAAGVAEAVRMTEEMQVFNTAAAHRNRHASLIEASRVAMLRTRTLSRTVPVLYQSAIVFMLLGGLAVLLLLETRRIAALGAIVLLLIRASSYGQQLQNAYQGVSELIPFLDRIEAAVQRFEKSRPVYGSTPLSSIQTIELREVSFGYRAEEPVLRSLTFDIRSGQSIGIIGPSGAGKSSVVQLLLGLRRATEGSVFVNGVPLHDYDREEWHRRIAYVPQDPRLLSATVAENIRYFRDVSDADVRRAARLAHIDEDIRSWRNGYDTVVGQRADAISGGQRQRLCLARALVARPELLVLDEPTSALDLQSEHLVQQSLQELRGELTLVVVAHRVSTLALCDSVLVLRDGRIEAFEEIEDIHASSAFFRRAMELTPGV